VAEELDNYFSSVFTKEDMQHMPDAVDASKNLESSLENITINKEIVMNKLQKLQIKLNLCCF